MSFNHVRDQAVPIRLLRHILDRNRIPNGLLFWGPGGVGKRMTAIELAKAINCTQAENDACDECLCCRKIMHSNHPDVKLVAPAGRARNIAVDTVDFMNELSAYRPFEGDWRVFIVQDAERMRIEAQNHFLKTLEEPPSNTLFILLTEFPRRLLPTIRSRCQQVRFGTLSPETVTEILQRNRDLPLETAQALAVVSQGQMSRALDLVDSEKRDVVLSLVQRLAQGFDPLALSEEFSSHLKAQGDAIRAAVKAESENSDTQDVSKEDREEFKNEQLAALEALIRRDLMEYLYLLETWYRDEWVFRATGDPEKLLNRDQVERLQAAENDDLEAKLGAIEKAWRYIERNLSVDRVFRDLFFALAP